ncbi:cytochrome P450, partial [Streptomyces sp. NPDC005406]
DLRAHFALPLPMGVICELLGVDEEHQDRLHPALNPIRPGPDEEPYPMTEAHVVGVACAGSRAFATSW